MAFDNNYALDTFTNNLGKKQSAKSSMKDRRKLYFYKTLQVYEL